ncbi:MAG TPA: response regulator transcription factor [Henriciella marina]|nr:response regulator transcription factor [Henriciella marina]
MLALSIRYTRFCNVDYSFWAETLGSQGIKKLAERAGSIAIIDDHDLFLQGLALIIERDFPTYCVETVTEASSILDRLAVGARFDLIICDLIMSEMNGLAFVDTIRKQGHRVPVLMLSGINSSPPIAEMQAVGANGFIHKSQGSRSLSHAVEAGRSNPFSFKDFSRTARTIGSSDVGEDCIADLPKLGDRQIEVLKLLSGGGQNSEIARALSISENTVKTHLKYIFVELGVSRRTECIQRAQQLGLI